MRTRTRKQRAIANRQELLAKLIPNAISFDYIAQVDRTLPNGFVAKVLNINMDGWACRVMAFDENKNTAVYKSNDFVTIQGVRVNYITV